MSCFSVVLGDERQCFSTSFKTLLPSEAKPSSFVHFGDAWNGASTVQKTLIVKVIVFTDK